MNINIFSFCFSNYTSCVTMSVCKEVNYCSAEQIKSANEEMNRMRK